MGARYVKTLRTGMLCGLVVMIVFGFLYLAGVNPYVDSSTVIRHWDEPASRFWQEVRGDQVEGYAWFLSHLEGMDSLSIAGTCVLILTPLIGVLLMIPRSRKIYLVLLLLLVVEFAYSILRPFV